MSNSGVLIIAILGTLAMYSGVIIGNFIRKYPDAVNFAEMGKILAGGTRFETPLYYFCAFILVLVLIFIMAAHVVSFQIMMIVSSHFA
jgi:hypothetical protein